MASVDYADLWVTAEELCDSTPEEPEYAVEEIMILGAITELTANIKAGKTTFMGQTLWSIFNGEEIVGLRTQQMDVLYLTEEGPNTFRSLLMRSGLEHETRLHVLHRGKIWRLPWKEIIEKVVLPKLKATGAQFVIVDTIARWAGIKGDEENQTGSAQAAMEPLETLRDAGYGIMVIRHSRKAGGEIGEAARGASAWGGASDVLLQLTNPQTHGHLNRRVLESLGRFHDPGKWTMDLEMGRYRLISRGDTSEREQVKQKLVDMQGSGQYTLPELVKKLGMAERTIERGLVELMPAGKITKSGAGKRGDPYVYRI